MKKITQRIKHAATASLATLSVATGTVFAAVDPAITTAVGTAQTDGVSMVALAASAVIVVASVLLGVGIMLKVIGRA
ncbi:MAG: hypothetical protein OQK82_00025 [Candidatus Pacearchaeota archaeon]|nr:hypothetical protein [Candidatus Pacearchaeota archaeon]